MTELESSRYAGKTIDEPANLNKILNNSVIMDAGDVKIPVASIEDMILMKEKAARPRDMIDIAALKQLQKMKKN